MFLIGPRTFDAAKAAYNRRDFRKARRIWVELARAGDPLAQCKLGDMYHYGVGVSQNIATAVAWYRKAAAQGNAEARTWLKLRDDQSLRRFAAPPARTLVRHIEPAAATRPPPLVQDPAHNAPQDHGPEIRPFLTDRPRAPQPAPGGW